MAPFFKTVNDLANGDDGSDRPLDRAANIQGLKGRSSPGLGLVKSCGPRRRFRSGKLREDWEVVDQLDEVVSR